MIDDVEYKGLCSICRERSHQGRVVYLKPGRLGWIWAWWNLEDVSFSIVHDGQCFIDQEYRLRRVFGRDILIKSRNTPQLEGKK